MTARAHPGRSPEPDGWSWLGPRRCYRGVSRVRTAWFWWRATRLRTWRSTVVVILLTGVLGAGSMAALARARRTESAYGRYLQSVNASDVFVNIPTPETSLISRVASVPGVRSSAAWVGIAANPVVHGRVDPAFQTDDLSGSVDGAFFRQDDMTIIAGRLPPLNSTNQVILTPGIAKLFGVGVGDRVTYRLYNPLITDSEVMVGSATFEVAAIGIFPRRWWTSSTRRPGPPFPPVPPPACARRCPTHGWTSASTGAAPGFRPPILTGPSGRQRR